jgi:hypothetical protein
MLRETLRPPAGPTMFGYMFAHEAHRRGQVIMLAASSATGCQTRLPSASGTGTSCGNSVVSTLTQDKLPARESFWRKNEPTRLGAG